VDDGTTGWRVVDKVHSQHGQVVSDVARTNRTAGATRAHLKGHRTTVNSRTVPRFAVNLPHRP
jgi:hypothetical protein